MRSNKMLNMAVASLQCAGDSSPSRSHAGNRPRLPNAPYAVRLHPPYFSYLNVAKIVPVAQVSTLRGSSPLVIFHDCCLLLQSIYLVINTDIMLLFYITVSYFTTIDSESY
jgi:hypothetical protein